MRTPDRLMMALAAVAVVQTVRYWNELPQHMASQFSGRGEPSGWMGKAEFFALYLGLLALIYAIFVPLSKRYAADNVRRHRPALPPGSAQFENAVVHLRAALGWLGVAHFVLAVATVQLVIAANLSGNSLSPLMIWLLGGYVVYMAWFFYDVLVRVR